MTAQTIAAETLAEAGRHFDEALSVRFVVPVERVPERGAFGTHSMTTTARPGIPDRHPRGSRRDRPARITHGRLP